MSQPFLYSVERQFPVTIDKLWHAWVDAKALEAWYHPTDLGSVKGATESDLTIGGLWSCGVNVPAHNFVAYFFGKYTKIINLERIEHSMHYTQSAEEFAAKDFTTPSHHIVIEFADRGSDSWVKFSQFGELPEGEEKRAQTGMGSYLDSLDKYLASN